jgi:hypothetical protein
MLFGVFPVKIRNDSRVVWESVKNMRQLKILKYKNNISDYCQKNLQSMLSLDPNKRMSWRNLVDNFTGYK